MKKFSPNTLWAALLTVRKKITALREEFRNLIILLGDSTPDVLLNVHSVEQGNDGLIIVSKNADFPIRNNAVAFTLEDRCGLSLRDNNLLDRESLAFLELYLPYCLAPIRARQMLRPFSVSHFAQSLDGRIATSNGNSQWIGNDENLTHAHRMRSLCDAVLIGSRTLVKDSPALTVRHVKGTDPVKIVIGSKAYNFDSLLKGGGELLYLTSLSSHRGPGVSRINIRRKGDTLDCGEIMHTLYEKGIYSVYIEGGGYTTSQFLKARLIDIVQLHIAPIIMGSGTAGFILPRFDSLDESVQFSRFRFYQQGANILFSGNVRYKD